MIPRIVAAMAVAVFAALAGVGSEALCAQESLPEMRTAADSALAARVEAAVRAASDLPADSLDIVAAVGVVYVSGSVVCRECGGASTPGGAGTVQQTLGALVRAVPGVEQVRFALRYRRP